MLLEPSASLIGNLNSLAGKLRHLLQERGFAVTGVKGTPGKVFFYISVMSYCGKGDLFQKDVEETFGVRPSSATAALQILEGKDLIRRESLAKDRRLKRIILTEKALESQPEIIKEAEKIESQLRINLSAREIRTFRKLSERISESVSRL